MTTDNVASFHDMRLGMFVHYRYGRPDQRARRADGSYVGGLDELADGLDVDDLVAVAQSMHAEYLQFTAWHAAINALYLSDVLETWLPGHCSRRDVIADLLEALEPTGIRLILYVHPSDGHDLTPEEQARTGWLDGPPYTRWNDFTNALFAEVVSRYRGRVLGYWVDGGLPPQIRETIGRLRETMRRSDPAAEVIQNDGWRGTHPRWGDYGSQEVLFFPYNADRRQVTHLITGKWWADCSYLMLPPELAFQYTVLQAGVRGHEGGGVAWNAGPYPGGQWEPGVREFFQKLGDYIAPVAPAIFGTRPSRSFVTMPGDSLVASRGARVVATESTAGATTYVHVLARPAGKALHLPVPYDGRVFRAAHLLRDEHKVGLVQDDAGLALTLAAGDDWDALDTVIVLRG